MVSLDKELQNNCCQSVRINYSDVEVINTEIRFCAGSKPARAVLEASDD